jgi:hypothetical protein
LFLRPLSNQVSVTLDLLVSGCAAGSDRRPIGPMLAEGRSEERIHGRSAARRGRRAVGYGFMPDIDATVSRIVKADAWNARVRLIQRIPEEYGRARLPDVYARLAQKLYVPELAPDFAYIHWRERFGLAAVQVAYEQAYACTEGFTNVTPDDLLHCLHYYPATTRIFRLILAFTPSELAAATTVVAAELGVDPVPENQIEIMEDGRQGKARSETILSETIARGVAGNLFPSPPFPDQRSKQDRPDLANGWESIRQYARDGVPLTVYLHQRYYGGAFAQVSNSTSRKRGNVLEDEVVRILTKAHVPFLRTGHADQGEIINRFNLTVHPAPDFVIYDSQGSLRGMLECKAINNGGTARDKASRFGILRGEADRLGGPPVFAVLGGLGWARTRDALGPVIRDCDGRVFTLTNLPAMLTVDPLPSIAVP